VLDFIQGSALSHAISQSNHLLIATLQVVHVLGFVLLLAALVLISLRLLNVVLTEQTAPHIARQALHMLWLGLALAVGSGILMFIGSPKHYYYNPAFELKMLLLTVAVIVQSSLFRKVVYAPNPRPALRRVSVALSLALWFAVSMAGRAIGFV
jgi:cytochrome bd-type quinol oxidase subunit 2